jgi:acetyl-CoA carboxylase biotin carboxyl carrier protein
MDHRELKKLVQLMNDNELVELEIERDGERVHLRKSAPEMVRSVPIDMASLAMGGVPAAHPGSATPVADEAPAGPPPGVKEIRSPMVGTFYRRPSPDAAPYVEVGQSIGEETVVCILEAMKVNNEIKAELEGEILEILVEDGQPVEFDQPLFLIQT